MSQNPKKSGRPSNASLITIVVAVAIAVIYFANTGGMAYLLPDLVATGVATPASSADNLASPSPTTFTDAPQQNAPAPSPTVPVEIDGVPTVRYEELPPEAHATIALIEQGGPFPYEKDGAVFQNREGRLPPRPSGYYREYTVVTPGEGDRGARRIVTGGGGEFYYTDDHYASFERVVQ